MINGESRVSILTLPILTLQISSEVIGFLNEISEIHDPDVALVIV
jgi:hypothetical protein